MKIEGVYGYNFDSNIYIVDGKIPTIIDCGTGLYHYEVIEKIKKIIDIKEIKQIILTHEHYDHCGGVKKLYDKIEKKPKVLAHFKTSEKIEKGISIFAQMLGGKMPKINIDIKIKNEDYINIGDESFKILLTPGHSPGSICLYNENEKSLVSGDTIFSYGSFGRYDLSGGSYNQLKKSIERLNFLDVENLYPGHDIFIEGEGNKHIKMAFENIRCLD